MKPFQFRGRQVLEWRRRQADTARGELMRNLERVREAEALVSDAEQRCARAEQDYRTALAGDTDAGTIVRHRNWIDREHAHRAACRTARDQQQKIAAAAAVALQDAMRNLKIMERLRERAWQEHRELEQQEEMKELNERATTQFVRQRDAARTSEQRVTSAGPKEITGGS